MKTICLLLMFTLVSCSDAPEPKTEVAVKTEKSDKKAKDHPTMKGYQDAIQKAKDMEKEVLKAAEKKKKMIDDLDG